MGILCLIYTLDNVNFAVQVAWYVLIVSRNIRRKGVCKNAYQGQTCPQLDVSSGNFS